MSDLGNSKKTAVKAIKSMSPYQGIPKKVRVGSIWIKILVGDNDDHEVEGTFGHFNSLKGLISLRPSMSSQQLANTFIHECIHAMNSVSRAGCGLDNYSDLEEDFTSKIANGIAAFWQDNPEAVLWWMRVNHLSSEA